MPMANSTKTDEWIAAVWDANPLRVMPDGSILTGPVRLHFADLFQPAKPMRGEVPNPNKPPKYGCTALFPAIASPGINAVIRPKVLELAFNAFPARFDENREPSGLHFPMRDQGEKAGDQQGFTRGGLFANVSTKFKPRVVDTAFADVEDEKRVYNGVWAILKLNAYTFNDPKKKGVSLGLQMAMLFADDTKLVSKQADPKAAFAGVKIDASFDAGSAFDNNPAHTPQGGYQKQTTADLVPTTNASHGMW